MTVYDIPPLNGPKRLFIGGPRNGEMKEIARPFKGQVIRVARERVLGRESNPMEWWSADEYFALPLQTVFGTHVWGYVHSSIRTGEEVHALIEQGRCAMSICGVFFPK